MNESRVDLRRLYWVGPLTVAAAVLGVLIVRVIGVAIVHPSPRFEALGWAPPVSLSVIMVIGAVLVFALVGRLSRSPLRIYFIVSVIVLVLTFIPDIIEPIYMLVPGASWPNAVVLMVMHVAAWAISVAMLSKLTVATDKEG